MTPAWSHIATILCVAGLAFYLTLIPSMTKD